MAALQTLLDAFAWSMEDDGTVRLWILWSHYARHWIKLLTIVWIRRNNLIVLYDASSLVSGLKVTLHPWEAKMYAKKNSWLDVADATKTNWSQLFANTAGPFCFCLVKVCDRLVLERDNTPVKIEVTACLSNKVVQCTENWDAQLEQNYILALALYAKRHLAFIQQIFYREYLSCYLPDTTKLMDTQT